MSLASTFLPADVSMSMAMVMGMGMRMQMRQCQVGGRMLDT